jgi:DNA-binding MarR family transcriptional regulator
MNNDSRRFAQRLSELDRLIHEPARLGILTILSVVDKADFLYLQREIGLSKGNLSAHLAKLEEAGYIQIEKTYRGKIPLTLCQITKTGQAAFKKYRDQMKTLMGRIS